MVDKSNEYGFVPSSPTQARGANTGVFEVNDVLDLLNAKQWSGNFDALELIQTQNYSTDVSSIDFTSINETEYDVHMMTINNLTAAANVGKIGFQFYEAGVLETAAVYEWAYNYREATGSGNDIRDNTTADILPIQNQISNASVTNAIIYFYYLGQSDNIAHYTFQQIGDASPVSVFQGGGTLPQQSVMDGIRITRSGSVNFTDYNISLYGISKS